jgi:hypothetical protein
LAVDAAKGGLVKMADPKTFIALVGPGAK